MVFSIALTVTASLRLSPLRPSYKYSDNLQHHTFSQIPVFATTQPHLPPHRATMSRFMKYASVAGKQVPINMATELQYGGYRRVIDAIDQTILNETVDKVKSALENNKLLSATQASSTSSVTITYVTELSNMKTTY